LLSIEQSKPRPDAALIRVSGRLTLGENSQQVESMVSALIAEGCRNVIFDLSGLTQIDSTGIGRFIASYRQLMAAGGALRMAAATPAVRSAFHVTRLDSVFPFFETVEEAIRAGGA
jgi:anti-sigma B factor antagonist